MDEGEADREADAVHKPELMYIMNFIELKATKCLLFNIYITLSFY